MISSEDIKESIVIKLLSDFNDISVYKEAKTNPDYPHFFVNQINVQDEEQRKNYHILTYSIMIRYRVASDPSTDLSLQTDLDDMGFELLQHFNSLDFNDSKVRCYDKMIEKVDGVLHFSFKIDLYAYDKLEHEEIKMNTMNNNIGVQ